MRMRPSFLVRLAILAGLLALAAIGGVRARSRYLPTSATLPGLRIDGQELSQGTDVRAFVASRARALGERRVRLSPEDDLGRTLFEASLSELGVSVDEEAVVQVATRLGHEGDLLGRIQTAEKARAGGIDVPLDLEVDPAVLLAIVD